MVRKIAEKIKILISIRRGLPPLYSFFYIICIYIRIISSITFVLIVIVTIIGKIKKDFKLKAKQVQQSTCSLFDIHSNGLKNG
jgi:hypothetical protein